MPGSAASPASQHTAILGYDFRTSFLAGVEGFVPAGTRQWLKYDAQGKMTVIPVSVDRERERERRSGVGEKKEKDARRALGMERGRRTRAFTRTHTPLSHTHRPKADKRPLIEELRLPFRDAVMVNPLVPTPYPPTIFIRDASLVLNLGSLRACVGADRVRGREREREWGGTTVDDDCGWRQRERWRAGAKRGALSLPPHCRTTPPHPPTPPPSKKTLLPSLRSFSCPCRTIRVSTGPSPTRAAGSSGS